MRPQIIFLSVLLISFLSGCASTSGNARINHNVSSEVIQEKLKSAKIVMLPPIVEVYELSATGSIEKDPEMTDVAKKNVDQVLSEVFQANTKTIELDGSNLTEEEQSLLREYVGLYDVVGRSANQYPTVWPHKAEKFDYSIGNGVQFLKEHTDADYALFISGQDIVSSGGRVATFIFFAALGVAIPMGQSYMTAGVVDLNTGDITWLDHSLSGSINLSDHGQTTDLIGMLFKEYPGMSALALTTNEKSTL